ncbi:MAG: hypothetical protein B6244_00790 [Candidatus Cloacimonetes bacterium 4572_55]|nr:MAG: hypothetical protein B6244_00790 [Candidatus Cloacimonetes bacterium 4572_55]
MTESRNWKAEIGKILIRIPYIFYYNMIQTKTSTFIFFFQRELFVIAHNGHQAGDDRYQKKSYRQISPFLNELTGQILFYLLY